MGLLFLGFSYGCTSTSQLAGVSVGENIILPANSRMAHWQKSTVEVADYELTLWQSSEGGMTDEFSLRTSFDKPRTLDNYRKLMDSAGVSNCVKFSSNLLDNPKQTTHPTLFWQVDCQLASGMQLHRLYLIIQGDEKFYHLQRNWESSVANTDLTWWQDYFRSVYVCNTNHQSQPCQATIK